VLYGGTEFELAYDVDESYKTSSVRGVPGTPEETYGQRVKTRLKNSLLLTPRMTLDLSWEYQFDQDLLALEYDFKVNNKYAATLRYDLLDWVNLTGDLKRETDFVGGADDEENTRSLTDSLKLQTDLSPVEWLKFSGRAEYKHGEDLAVLTGASVDTVDEESYEVVAKNRFGEFWDLSLDATERLSYEDGFLVAREAKFKADLRMKLWDFSLQPTYEVGRTTDWTAGFEDFDTQKRTAEWRIRFEWRRQFFGLLQATFSHEYGVKTDDTLDEVRSFEHTVALTEDTRINLVLAELVRDLRLEGEIDRRGGDTEHDADPMLVDVAYSLKLDYKLEPLTLSASFKYNSKGDSFDDMALNSKIEWKLDQLALSGEYEFAKIFAEETSETRKLNLKLNYRF
jgi:hypothetical protein